MKESSENFGENQRGKVKAPFFCIGNEVFDVFLPIMGIESLAIYAWFRRMEFSNPSLAHTLRVISKDTGIGVTTVSRSLEILEHLGLVKLTRFGGSKGSECQLPDSKEVANKQGAKYNPKTLSYSLPPQVAQRLKAEVKALRERQQGRTPQTAVSYPQHGCGNRPAPVSQRDASISPEIRQRSTRETQTGAYLLQEEGRNEDVPSPTPSRSGNADSAKTLPNKDGPDELLKQAVNKFTGVMKDMRDHLLGSNRPQAPHLANGFDDWQEYGFSSMAVEAVARRGEDLELMLSADNPAAALCGVEKYRQEWNESLRKWFAVAVQVDFQQSPPIW